MAREDRIKHAQLDWDAKAKSPTAPRSVFFDDVYFSGDGPAETQHVFLNGNDLPARFNNATLFTVGELGFGTGLNFLAVWDAWRKAEKPASARLHFFSTEAFPLSAEDMARAHQAWPRYQDLAAALRAKSPPAHPGFHRLEIDKDVVLTLYYGDAHGGLRRLEAHIDAWFFDGFSPAKNPAMWSLEIFNEAARLSKCGATFATFTVAGHVRRALEGAGFALEKRTGYGRKREMLTGRLERKLAAFVRQPWFETRSHSLLKHGASIAIIGAGIAGASAAHALSRAGFAPVVFEADRPACGASGNPAGLIMPRLDLDDTPAGRFHASAYFYALKFLKALGDDIFNPCGVLHRATTEKEKERQKKLFRTSALPPGWIEQRDEGLFFPQAGVVDPAVFVKALLVDIPLYTEKVKQLNFEGLKWQIDCASGRTEKFDAVIIANSLDALRFSQMRNLPLAGSAGQVDYFPNATPPDHAEAFGPYAAPAPKGGLVIGATYAPIAIGEEPAFAREASESTIAAIGKVLPALAARLSPEDSHPRTSIRCVTPDRLPVVGGVPDWGYYSGAYDGLRTGKKQNYPIAQSLPGLFALTGLGSRGLMTAPLAAAMIAAEITGEPAPVDVETAEAVHPARFFIRDLKRGKPVKSPARE